jgi:acyl-CoA thioester hydrolase
MSHRLRVRFIEVDIQGVMHNAHYVAYFGIGLGEYYRALKYDRAAAAATHNVGLYVVSANVLYKAPLLLDEEADICARVSRIGRTSVTFDYEIYKVKGDVLSASGNQVWVNADRATQKSAPWDPEFVRLVEQAEGRRLAT